MPHKHRVGSGWLTKRQLRNAQRLELYLLRRDMWLSAHKDHQNKEIVATGDFKLHPEIPIVAGDVLVQSYRFLHPALTTPIPEKPRDPHSRGSWSELIDRLPKRKKDH